MYSHDAVIAVFNDHAEAETAVRKLIAEKFDMKTLSIVGKGYHTEETIVGFYNTSDRIKFWGARGAFWGGLWGLFFGGLFVTLPVVGSVVVLGYLAATALAAIEGAVVVGGVSAIGAALASIGAPEDSVLRYETALKADGFLVMAHGSASEVERAKTILANFKPTHLNVHAGANASQPDGGSLPAVA
jgi:hypothetical protein